jgi:hypothetical protein
VSNIPTNMNFPNVTDTDPCDPASADPQRLFGHGPPPGDLGGPGDTYVNVDDGSFWWKSETQWNPGGALVNPPPGTTTGHGPPDASMGQVGSVYTDIDSGAFYWKSTDGWHP